MNAKVFAKEVIATSVRRLGYEIVDRRQLYEWQMPAAPGLEPGGGKTPEAALGYLVPQNPHLLDLRNRYAKFDNRVTTPLAWTDSHVTPQQMQSFRGENAYVWQLRGLNMNPLAYALTAYYVKAVDRLGLFDRLTEDGLFGCIRFEAAERLVSRDLLDSIVEISFLERHLEISKQTAFRVLDIGAGYGRLAHRMTSGLPNVASYLCTDAYPVSTFISEYYLQSRGADERGHVVALDEIEAQLAGEPVDLAINIHSFSECRLTAIEWWLALISKNQVRHLMIVPNSDQLATNDGVDFRHLIEKYGYRQIASDPKYLDPVVQRYGVNPARHFLFELGR